MDLLVGGPGLHHFNQEQLSTKHSAGTQIFAEGFDSSEELSVAQNKKEISVWAMNSHSGILYFKADSELKTHKEPVQLIPDNQGGKFSAFAATPNDPPQYVFNNAQGYLSILQQDPATKFWETIPFFIPYLDKMTSFQAYVTRIYIMGQGNHPLRNVKVRLKSTGAINAIINGKAFSGGPEGIVVKTDSRGCLFISFPTGDITVDTIEVSSSQMQGGPITIDPMVKIRNQLKKIQNGDDLRNASLQGGGKLLDGISIPKDQVDQAAHAIRDMFSKMDEKGCMTGIPAQPTSTETQDDSDEWASWWDVLHVRLLTRFFC